MSLDVCTVACLDPIHLLLRSLETPVDLLLTFGAEFMSDPRAVRTWILAEQALGLWAHMTHGY